MKVRLSPSCRLTGLVATRSRPPKCSPMRGWRSPRRCKVARAPTDAAMSIPPTACSRHCSTSGHPRTSRGAAAWSFPLPAGPARQARRLRVAARQHRAGWTIPHRANTLVVFPNGPLAVHGAELRQVTPHDRAYVLIPAEVEADLFQRVERRSSRPFPPGRRRSDFAATFAVVGFRFWWGVPITRAHRGHRTMPFGR